MKTYLAAKLHRIRVTAKSLDYIGSVSIDTALLRQAGIDPYEQVAVVNLNNGARWVTYALASSTPGEFALNGGGARLGELGDVCVVMSYRLADAYQPATVLFLDERNGVSGVEVYQ